MTARDLLSCEKIRTLENEGCGTENPELEFQGLKPHRIPAVNLNGARRMRG
jgi:hypothetical protein